MNGVIKDIPMDVYRKDLGLAASDLKTLVYQTPKHFKAKLDGLVPNKDSASLSLGTLVHMAILEPEEFERRAVQEPAIDRRTKEYKQWKAEQSDDALILSPEDDRIIIGIIASVEESGLTKLWRNARRECSVFAEVDGIEMKARPDALNGDLGLIVDLKTTRDLKWFAADARKYHYPFSVPHYQKVCQLATGDRFEYVFVAVETEAPYDFGWYRLSEETLGKAAADHDEAIQIYKRCTETGLWPGYLTDEPGLI